MNINERITKVIQYSTFTSSEFADEIDVQRSSVSHITSGRNKPSLEFITKIKSRFPEIEWDWLITGIGEMLITKKLSADEITEEVQKPTSLPDLFSIINEEIEHEIPTIAESVSENRPEEKKEIKKENMGISEATQIENIVGAKSNIKRIVIFYNDGKFESFEP
ncbi:hypothetical protein ASG01_01455 [Chryseobacterium sp. Leaf180]|uniref:helix-turn-helix domain-containing protein n=1 Tax=Chryseobacterium sp. Leaf180 TaxID=1736289 RepID=UPI0007020EA2|nr:helix-turn-helix transcriptional regulator [Chryseobacterium sp. Leaf180]KQR94579.1 hypothetical protein ASG01_01455 [Chryseobacterium sp. Leaf180]